MKSVVLINTMRCSRKYPHSSHGSFFGLDPHPPPPPTSIWKFLFNPIFAISNFSFHSRPPWNFSSMLRLAEPGGEGGGIILFSGTTPTHHHHQPIWVYVLTGLQQDFNFPPPNWLPAQSLPPNNSSSKIFVPLLYFTCTSLFWIFLQFCYQREATQWYSYSFMSELVHWIIRLGEVD